MRRQGEQTAVAGSSILLDKLLSSRGYRAAYYMHRAVLMTKLALLIAMLACILFVKLIVANADAAPSKPKNATGKDRAYTMTLLCATFASDGDNDRDILRTMDALRKMGKAKGYDDKRIANDLGTMASVVGDKLRTEPNYIDDNREICRKLQLIE